MPSVFLYATPQDGETIRGWLNTEPDIAWITTDRPGHWVAQDAVSELRPGNQMLWHSPGGSLPLFASLDDERPEPIPDPWSGWTALVTGQDRSVPWFANCPAVLEFGFYPQGSPLEPEHSSQNYLGVSHFGWIGDRYRGIGDAAGGETRRWWARLRRWIGSVSVKVTGAVPTNSPPMAIMAFPDAYRLIERGEARRYTSRYRSA